MSIRQPPYIDHSPFSPQADQPTRKGPTAQCCLRPAYLKTALHSSAMPFHVHFGDAYLLSRSSGLVGQVITRISDLCTAPRRPLTPAVAEGQCRCGHQSPGRSVG
jgi:hypothetical protein